MKLSISRLIIRWPALAVIAACAAIVIPNVNGQTTQTVTVTSTVPGVLSLGIDTNAVSIPFLAGDYSPSTKVVAGANTLAVTSNKSWTVNLKANTAAFSFVPSAGDPDPAKAAGNFSYKVSTAGAYTAITTSNVVAPSPLSIP